MRNDFGGPNIPLASKEKRDLMTEQNETGIVDALIKVKIAIESLSPDPTQTIGDYRKGKRRKNFWLLYSAIVSTIALIVSIGQLIIRTK